MLFTWYQRVSVFLIACNLHGIETACQPDCAWVGWTVTNECTEHCSGTSRLRYKELCCREYESFEVCAWRCGRQDEDAVFLDSCNAECNNGGTYSNDKCNCVDGTNTRCCGEEIDECDSIPCLNGAMCEDGAGSYSCDCAPGYTGNRCETDVDDCESNPCINGTCVDAVNSYSCDCDDGYEGARCDSVETDECDSNPCLNKATCEDGYNSYSCDCATGYTGTRCEKVTDECDSNPCLNKATCEDGYNSYSCDCTTGYTGTRCETAIKNTAAKMEGEVNVFLIWLGLYIIFVNGLYGTVWN